METVQSKKDEQLNKLASQNKFWFTFKMVLKVILVLIYGIGFYIEKCALFLYRTVKRLITIGVFQAVCNVGEWILRTGKAIGRFFAKAATAIAGSFVKNFSWWAPAIGLVCIISILVFSNFFSIALEVTINGNVVGYVRDEKEYHEVLNKVENQIQSQLSAGTVAEQQSEQGASDNKNNTAVSQSSAVSAVAEKSEGRDGVASDEDGSSVPNEVNAENTALNLDSEAYALTTTTKYALSVVRKSDLQNEDNLYTDVYFAVSELVGTNYGLYVDGELKAACADKETIEKVLDEVKSEYDTNEPGSRLEFVEDVQVKKGMFATDSLKDEQELRALFESDENKPAYYTCTEDDYMSTVAKKFGMTTAQLQALNPDVKDTEIYPGRKLNIAAPEIYLQVKTVKTVTYTESIAYDVKRVSNSDLYKGTTKVKTEGQKGSQTVTAEITYINGERKGKKVISTEVTKEPVDKVIYVGTKKRTYSNSYSSSGSSSYNFTQGSGVPSGSFSNPLPGAYLSCGFRGYSGHTGADLCLRGGTLGAAVYAADGGTVEYAGWSGGYGRLIRINHGNGFTTYYAHLSAMFVSPGDKVSSGQQIGKAGSSGNSTGPHLHFEVRYKGTAYNPLNYISL